MESVQAIMDQIKKETEPSGALYLCCPLCGTTSILNPTNPIPASCYACSKPTAFGTGPTPNAAKEKAASMAHKTQPAQVPVQPQPVAPQPAPTNPAPVANVATEQAQAAKPKRAAKSKEQQPSNQQSNAQQTEQVVQQVGVPMTTADWKVQRIEATSKFITTHNLNQVEVKPVGHAQVFTFGFTQWSKVDDGRQVPSYTLSDPGDDPSVYNDAKRKAKMTDGKIMNDVVMLTNIDDAILPVLYNAELIASIVGKRGRVACKVDDAVEVGARLSASGSIIWSVIRKL